MPTPRNVIIITSDEMRGDCQGYTGNPDCKTPHIDALAARATACMNHFCAFPKCVPSRVALATGRYTHTEAIRTVNNTNHLPVDAPDLMKTLRDAHGYETAVFGLNHVWDDFFGDNRKGTQAVDYHSFTVDGGFGAMVEERDCPPVPDDARSEIDPGEVPEGLRPPYRKTGKLAKFDDQIRCEQAIRYLREVRDRERPFFLQLNISKPHPAYDAPEPWFSMYDPEAITPFPYGMTANGALPREAQRRHRTGTDVSERFCRELQAVYYSMISRVDEQVGQVVAAIDAEDLWDDSVVIFTADHGDYAGQYGLIEKFDADLSDCLLRVPFLIKAPGLGEGVVHHGLSEHVDVAPTILGLLGLEPDVRWHIHGEDLRPLLAGEREKRAVFADGGHEAPMRARFNGQGWKEADDGTRIKPTDGKQLTYELEPDSMAKCKMVRTARHKLVVREVGGDELYDLAADPHELDNRIGTPEHAALVAQLQRELLDWCLRTDTDRPFQEKVGA